MAITDKSQIRDNKLSIVVTGDVTLDCSLVRKHSPNDDGTIWHSDSSVRAYWKHGGALLLAELIQTLVMSKIICPKDSMNPCDNRFHRSFAVWSHFEKEKKKGEQKAWRVAEYLGLQKADETKAGLKIEQKEDVEDADIVILDDADLGFRKRRVLWPKAIGKEKHPWVLLKMASPIAQGELWEHLHRYHAEKLIVLMNANDLRLTKAQVSRELSWELTAQDLVRELVHNHPINAISHCCHVIVSFGTSGAILLSRQNSTIGNGVQSVPQSRLIFDPQMIEGMWRQTHPGGMIGYNSCLTASIAFNLIKNPKRPDVMQGVIKGLSAMRKLHLEGYNKSNDNTKNDDFGFPVKLIADELIKRSEKDSPFISVTVRNPALQPQMYLGNIASKEKPSEFWTILADRYADDLEDKARQIVIKGPKTSLKDVPLGSFGELLTVDRREIESFRSIRTLVNEYVGKAKSRVPLSIAVFGPPGSGKSFGIAQMAKELLQGKIHKLTFNLSQFDTVQNLWDALHQVRDVSLSEKIPLVFWDEFDTNFEGKLGWLRYFLSPMQDGTFQEGQITHPIGRAIFVFAGGTANSMNEFGKEPKDEKEKEAYKAAKVPDFLSRLKGFVNILGPNPCKIDGVMEVDEDKYYIIRRAILLHTILKREAPHLFNSIGNELQIDDGVLRALLETKIYKHGVRSMESLIAMSMLKGKRRFERSALPSDPQLNLHVDAMDFMSLVHKIEPTKDLLDRLAPEVHKAYQEIYPLKDYDKLSKGDKKQNYDFAEEIPIKLSEINYVMMPARGNLRIYDFTDEEVDHLAEIEHERYLKDRLKDGWRYGEKKDAKKKLNNAIKLWREMTKEELDKKYSPEEQAALGEGVLSDEHRKTTKHMIEKIPRILSAVGYTVVKLAKTL